MGFNYERKQFPLLYVQQHARAIMGFGAGRMVAQECAAYGIKHALLVTTGLRTTGIVEEVESILKYAGIAVTVFSGVTTNPKDFEVAAGTKVYLEAGCDGVVSVGGGSSHDCGKAIRLYATNDGPKTKIMDFAAFIEPSIALKMPLLKEVRIPHIGVTTTTGTGADGTHACIITDTEANYKCICLSPGLIPNVSIVDPAYARTQPNHLVAWTGMDAFLHCLEPFVGRLSMPFVRAVGLRGIKLISENIRQAYANPKNDAAMENLTQASFIASMAYDMGGGMGMVHGLAHMLSCLRDYHHGYSNAQTMMPVSRFNLPGAPERYQEIGEAMGLDVRHMSPVSAAEKTLEAIEKMRNDIGIAQVTSEQLALTESELEHIGKWCFNDISYEANPRDMNFADMKNILTTITA